MNFLFSILFVVLVTGTLSAQQKEPTASQGPASRFNAQQAGEHTPAARLAQHIADKLTDSLGLSNQQRAKVVAINIDIYKEKAEKRSKSTDRNIVGRDLQAIEATRDARYKVVLNQEQYERYLAKKATLITSK